MLIDRLLSKITRSILERLNVNRGPLNLNSRRGAFHKCWGHVFTNHLHGDYVEFGVYRGDSLIESIEAFLEFKKWLLEEAVSPEQWRAKQAQSSPLNDKIMFHGLDTFQGIPANDEHNFTFSEGDFYAAKSVVENRLKKHFTNGITTHLYEGSFKSTGVSLKKTLFNRKISIANIDCDLESSAMCALNIIEEFLQIGSIIMFDDYNAFSANNNKGERAAFSKFREKSRFVYEPYFPYQYVGQAFLTVEAKPD